MTTRMVKRGTLTDKKILVEVVALAILIVSLLAHSCVADGPVSRATQEQLDPRSLIKACQAYWENLNGFDVLVSLETTISYDGREFPSTRSKFRLRMNRQGKTLSLCR
ncbi:hypothetical protein Poly21_53170 [Allorhodopirellula heiligendammensis]|uniref:Uncharacterized protein n=1 Tax=Allorhodopirellula heiligendammensis TaxID=2714739 RepID=A0A5C6BHT0_9BACT|nr:hypothetical protein Poly21_53170 [Allorhodopirellula heiligendammensis]